MAKISGKKVLKKIFNSQDSVKNVNQLASILNTRQSVVNSWNTRDSIPFSRCEEIADLLNIDLNYLLNADNIQKSISFYGETPVSAGAGAFVLSEKPTAVFQSVEDLMQFFIGYIGGDVIGFKVNGDSMSPTLNNGDTVVANKTNKYKTDGIYIVRYDGHLYIKRLIKQTNSYTLQSDNPEYTDIITEQSDDFEIIATAEISLKRI